MKSSRSFKSKNSQITGSGKTLEGVLKMTEIKRYSVVINPYRENSMMEYPQGEWVRWDDVKDLLQKQEDWTTHELRLMSERIKREWEKPEPFTQG